MLDYFIEGGGEANMSSADKLREILNMALPDQQQTIMTFKAEGLCSGPHRRLVRSN
jgi:hypothetical protein